MKKIALSFAIVLSVSLATPLTAQHDSKRHNRIDADSECRGSSCQRNLFREIRALRRSDLPEEEFNSQLGRIAANLFEQAKEEESKRVSKRVSAALLQLARFSTDEQQSESFVLVARILRDGDVDLFEIDDPFAVSPS